MIYSHRCTECQLLRCTEDGKSCDECLANMSNTIEAEAPATATEEGLSRFLEKSFQEYFEQLKKLRTDPNAAQQQPPPKIVDVPNPKAWDPGFFRVDTNYVDIFSFLRGEVIPKLQERHDVIVTSYSVGHSNFDINIDLREPLPATQAVFNHLKQLEKDVVADLNSAFTQWAQNGHMWPWPC